MGWGCSAAGWKSWSAFVFGFRYGLTLPPTLLPHRVPPSTLGAARGGSKPGSLEDCFLACLLACWLGRPALALRPPFSRPPASHRIIFLGSVEVTGTVPFQMEGTFSRGRDLIHLSVWGSVYVDVKRQVSHSLSGL